MGRSRIGSGMGGFWWEIRSDERTHAPTLERTRGLEIFEFEIDVAVKIPFC